METGSTEERRERAKEGNEEIRKQRLREERRKEDSKAKGSKGGSS